MEKKHKITKDEYVNNLIYKIVMPYIMYLKIMLSNDNVYNQMRESENNFDECDNVDLNILIKLIEKQLK